MWAIDASGDAPLTDEQARRIRAAAVVAASHMLDDFRVRKATQIPREDRLRTLLDGTNVMGSELAELGMTEERGATLLAFSHPQAELPTVPAQLRSTVQRHLELYRPEAVSVVRGGRVYALVANDPTTVATSLAEPLIPILDRLIGPGVLVTAPGVAHRSAEVAPLRDLADRLFDTAARGAMLSTGIADRILTVESLRPLLVFERAAAVFAESPELRSRELDRMLNEEPQLAETLRVWCGSFGNIAQTARALGIHENTARYRLRRAREKYGVDLTDPDFLLATWLQLRASR
ncbi:PucR family transcriptional regulator [Leucobacter coleopterorum]|uniref:PucR family transcriptional regulator n=1 Tax=Leucobacter coleopterorum TaxID=2714933 RepID=UPI001FCCAD03|nr:PucR family transcriptional regulator [Leucobacter coleopterorum]